MADIVVVGHKTPDTDSVCSAIIMADLLSQLGYDAEPIMQGDANNETRFVLERFSMPMPRIATSSDAKVALVDHSERGQSLDGLRNEQVFAVVDHHKIGDVQSAEPIVYINIPVASTATVLHDLYGFYGKRVPDTLKGIMLASIISDTAIFKSPTCTEHDVVLANALAKDLGLDPIEFGKEQFRAKADFTGKSVDQIIMLDCKRYDTHRGSIAIAQIEVPDTRIVLDRKEAFLSAMDAARTDGSIGFIFIVTDILREGSEVLISADDVGMFSSAMGITFEDDHAYIPGLMSRKKQIVPLLDAAFNRIE